MVESASRKDAWNVLGATGLEIIHNSDGNEEKILY